MDSVKKRILVLTESEYTIEKFVEGLKAKDVSELYYDEIQSFFDSNADEPDEEDEYDSADEWYNSVWHGKEVEEEVTNHFYNIAKETVKVHFTKEQFEKLMFKKFPFLEH